MKTSRASLPPDLRLGSRYLISGDVRRPVPRLSRAHRLLSQVPIERALDWVARMVAPAFRGSEAARAHELSIARAHFTQGAADQKALDLIVSRQRQLFAPHMLLHLARLALLHGSDAPAGDHEKPRDVARYERLLLEAMLIAAHHAGARARTGTPAAAADVGNDVEPVTAMDLELAANITANRKPFPPSSFHRSERRWIEIPSEDPAADTVDLAAEYEAATGVKFADLRMVGAVLWARTAAGGRPHIGKDHLLDLGIGPERTDAVMRLISADIPTLQAANRNADRSEYDSSLFSRFPVARCRDGSFIIMNQAMLVERTLGWLPRHDLEDLARGDVTEGKRRSAAAVSYLRTCTERQAAETVRAIVTAESGSGRVYDEIHIQQSYGTSRPNADLAVVWPEDIAVIEVSSRTIMRGTAAGSSTQAFIKDLNLGVRDKVAQIDATICEIRANLSALTGAAEVSAQRRFWPVLVTTEGWPVTPRMTLRVRRALALANLLQHSDIEPLIIVDLEGLEAAEAVVERTGLTWAALLEQHQSSDLSTHGFRDWLVDRYAPVRPTRRIMSNWDRTLAPALRALDAAEADAKVMPHDEA